MFPDLSQVSEVAVDTETYGLKWYDKDQPFSFAVSVKDQDWYFDIRECPGAVDWMTDMFKAWKANGWTKLINQNLKFDIHMLRTLGIPSHELHWEQYYCTMIQAALIDEHRFKYDLDSLGRDYLGDRKVGDIYADLAAEFGGKATRGVQTKNFHRASVDLIGPYAMKDTNLALRLHKVQRNIIKSRDLEQVDELERRLFPCIIDMEWNGIRVDLEQAERTQWALEEKITKMRQELDQFAGFEVNPNPSGSLHKLFAPEYRNGKWYAKDGTPLSTTPAGKASLNADALKAMKDPAAKMVLACRKLMKAKGTFIEGHVMGHMVKRDGQYWVHPNINQTKGDDTGGTGTGRLSYTEPALQQIPSRDREVAELIRPIFLPDPGQKWSYADAEQQEFRMFAHYANSPKIIEGYKNDVYMDMHGMVAELTKLPRKAPESGGANAKQLNLGMVFNMGAGELASQMGLPYEIEEVDFGDGPKALKKAGPEADDIMELYYSKVPGVREVAKKARSVAKSRGYVKTMWGRQIRFPGKKFTHKASGLIYQGSSADLMKINIIRTYDYMKQFPEIPARLLLVIHDEENISIPDMDPAKTKEYLTGLKLAMQDFPGLRVPIVYDWSEPSDNWWLANEAKEVTHGWELPKGAWYG